MSLIDDTCDKCGRRFDPMGDPLLTKRPEIGPYAVFCESCEREATRTRLVDVLMAHTDETCSDRDCGLGFGYHDCDSREDRRRGCGHLADVVLTTLRGDA